LWRAPLRRRRVCDKLEDIRQRTFLRRTT